MPAEKQSGRTADCPPAHGLSFCYPDNSKWIELLRQFIFFGWSCLHLHGDALAVVGGVARMALRGVNVQTPDELAVNDKALGLFLLDQLV